MQQMVPLVMFRAVLRTHWMATFSIRLVSRVDGMMHCKTMAAACCVGCTEAAMEGS